MNEKFRSSSFFMIRSARRNYTRAKKINSFTLILECRKCRTKKMNELKKEGIDEVHKAPVYIKTIAKSRKRKKRVMLFFHRPQHAGMSHWELECAGNVQQITIFNLSHAKWLFFTHIFPMQRSQKFFLISF